ncbi:ABC transporter substrate-binding protein [uncultured Finegoldia sp.]|uniref:ABC transporter substrate-binding protein n=1 Tax=uncultured Finegoldia sp. TaxID=328009 RepID=UPI0026054B99|nr:ABC transporter substrate-binding protein [uncultured Finegoldia sp.]
MRKKNIFKIFLVLMLIVITACSNNQKTDNKQESKSEKKISDMSFDEIKAKAKGKTVNFYGYGGDILRNDFIDKTFIPYAEKTYGIKVKRVPMDIDAINNLLMNEKQANKPSNVDVVWINGENFYSNKKQGLLFGPFTDKLPNFNKYIDKESSDVKYDFANPTDGYEAPYGKAQLVLIYDTAKVPNPPKNLDELKEWIKKNPGKFTYAQMPDFTSSAFVRNIISNTVGYKQFMDTSKNFSEEELTGKIKPALDYLKEIKPYLWKEGKVYPKDQGTLNNMYRDGEVYMTMSYNPSAADAEIAKGNYPKTTRTFLLDKGMIGNTHFLAIAEGSQNKEGAMCMIDAMLSFEMQLEKAQPKVLGDMPVFDINKLSADEKQKLDKMDLGIATLPLKELQEKRIPEMPAKLVPQFEKIWEKEILQK